ncbi:cilia- and flagella-associated protein 157 [Polypterus senegalus]|uniref:cilia- and flagella-associated protein 157 n=1 Tax=Polypterus senegalus TaxID=55291 RepID=UPI0019627F41|nr:cilia- and flagella-associated protein 157 [Polypterus senegalus]
MPPKKKKGGKKSGKKKAEKVEEPLTEECKEFYLLQIKDLEEQVQRYQAKCDELEVREKDLINEYETLKKDKKEIVSFLKRTLDQRADELADLTDRFLGLQQAKEAEKVAFEAQLAQLRHEFQETKDQLTSENMVLAGKLASLEEFRLHKEEMIAKIAGLEALVKSQEDEHQAAIYDLEKKNVLDKDRLKKEMLERVASVAVEFRRVSDKQTAETTKRMIRENVLLSARLSKASAKCIEVLEENQALKEQEEIQRRQLGVVEQGQNDLARRSISNQKIVRMLTEKCKTQQNILQSYVIQDQETTQLQSRHVVLQKELDAVRQELQTAQKGLELKNKEAEELKQHLMEEQEARDKMGQILKGAAFALKEVLLETSSEDEPLTDAQDSAIRSQMLQALLSLLDSAAMLGLGPALKEFFLDAPDFLMHKMEPGGKRSEDISANVKAPKLLPHYKMEDLGLVPRPTQPINLPKVDILSKTSRNGMAKHLTPLHKQQAALSDKSLEGRPAGFLPQIKMALTSSTAQT